MPPQGQNDQTYYKQSLPARDKGNVRVTLSHLASGQYARQVYRIGYGLNDPFSDYLAIGAPSQLTPAQVRFLKEKNSGAPVLQDTVTVTGGVLTDTFPIRTNDVYQIVLRKISDKP